MGQVFRYPFKARFQDIDAAGILFFARNFDYFHDAYVAFLDALGLPLDSSLKTADFLLPLVHAEADFVAPMRFGQSAEIELTLSRLGESSYTVYYRIQAADKKQITRGETVHCCVVRSSFESRALPEQLRQALLPYLDAAEA
jgi:1,4-dihydroxy-2-naphthoyl-CoA hydrolase